MYSYILSQHFIDSTDNKILEQNSIEKDRHSSDPCTSTIINFLCSPLAHASTSRWRLRLYNWMWRTFFWLTDELFPLYQSTCVLAPTSVGSFYVLPVSPGIDGSSD